jgi:hypothetical protein
MANMKPGQGGIKEVVYFGRVCEDLVPIDYTDQLAFLSTGILREDLEDAIAEEDYIRAAGIKKELDCRKDYTDDQKLMN